MSLLPRRIPGPGGAAELAIAPPVMVENCFRAQPEQSEAESHLSIVHGAITFCASLRIVMVVLQLSI